MAQIIGRKVGMTQYFAPDGACVPVTLVEAGPNTVMEKKTADKHGYSAIKVGFGAKESYRLNKPDLGQFKKLNLEPRETIRELRMPAADADKFEVGAEIKLDGFAEGDLVDVSGTGKGKGFAGVMKRHHMRGGRMTHGGHEYKRHGGSIGQREWPGHVWSGMHMAGQLGNKRITTQNVKLVKVDAEKNLLFLHGSVPGAPGAIIEIQHAVKRRRKRSEG